MMILLRAMITPIIRFFAENNLISVNDFFSKKAYYNGH